MAANVCDYGAIGDGVTNDTAAIQRAIDECAKNGGGEVLIPGGKTYYVGSIQLRSHIHLHFESGAKFQALSAIEQYDYFEKADTENKKNGLAVPSFVNCDYSGRPAQFFIYAKDVTNVSITGFGTIDGNEEIFYGDRNENYIDGFYYPRIPMLYLENVKQLTIKDVTLTRSAFWTVHMIGCQDVLIDGIRILNNKKMMNCDGIDPDHCKNVRIVNCYITAADDGIVLKNTKGAREYGITENVCVTNCTIESSSAAIKFGTESEDDFRNILFENINITGTNRGISMQLRDGGNIENVLFQNMNIETRRSTIEWWGDGEAIAITAIGRKPELEAGRIRNVRFSNINCIGETGIFLYGTPEKHNVADITLKDIQLHMVSKTDLPKINHDLRPTDKYETVVQSGLNAVYARNIDNLKMENINVYVDDDMKQYYSGNFDIE